MSLDMYFKVRRRLEEGHTGIYVMRDGDTVEVSREDWDKAYPGTDPLVLAGESEEYVGEINVTHNLGLMASKAGLYTYMWEANDRGLNKASNLTEGLRAGLKDLIERPDYYKEFNPLNGWGTYEGLVETVQDLLSICENWPDAEVRVSR